MNPLESSYNHLLVQAEHGIHPAHDGICFGIVGMIFARNLENGRNRLIVRVEQVPDVCGDVLVYQNNGNVRLLVNLRNAPSMAARVVFSVTTR